MSSNDMPNDHHIAPVSDHDQDDVAGHRIHIAPVGEHDDASGGAAHQVAGLDEDDDVQGHKKI